MELPAQPKQGHGLAVTRQSGLVLVARSRPRCHSDEGNHGQPARSKSITNIRPQIIGPKEKLPATTPHAALEGGSTTNYDNALSANAKKHINQVQVFALLAGPVASHRVTLLV